MARRQSSMSEFKVVLIGECGVGKSSMFVRVKENRFTERLNTVGLDYTVQQISFKRDDSEEKECVRIRLWDTAGLERTGTLTSNYYKYSHAILMMYDVTRPSTLDRLKVWMEEAQANCKANTYGRSVKYFIIGNKIDSCSTDIEIDEQSAFNFAQMLTIPKEHVFRISVKTAEGLDKLQNELGRILSDNMLPAKPHNTSNPFIDLHENPKEKPPCPCMLL